MEPPLNRNKVLHLLSFVFRILIIPSLIVEMHSITLLSSGFSLLSILSLASATCKTFTPTTTPIKITEGWGTDTSPPIDVLDCPRNSTQECVMPTRNYSVYIAPQIFADKGNITRISSVSDVNSIFSLTQDALKAGNQSISFAPLTGRVTPEWTRKEDYLVSPGETRTYYFAANLLTIEGKADGCEDASLNNRLLRVLVPQLNANGTNPLGSWMWSSVKLTPITPTPSPTPSGVTPTVTPTTPKSEGVGKKVGGAFLALVTAGVCAILL
ncbi:hypothetical protein BGZ60DRAFT_405054 [Tricladium varicosporioides]|nr:hypothetical protein BGZ60DRAFT_405054 [Hymenoscyphus varicosporioides]